MNKLSEILENRRREIEDEAERRKQHMEREKDEQRLIELQEREKLMWEQFNATSSTENYSCV